MTGKLLLLPNLLDEESDKDPFLPGGLSLEIPLLQGLFCESEKIARRYLRRFLSHEAMQQVCLQTLNEHTPQEVKKEYMKPLLRGEVWGVLSDAGLPCIADPGAELVWMARQQGIIVQTYSGPCSIWMALQLSGFSGQRFTFHGYLPREVKPWEERIIELEKKALGHTQIWIEAPYRSSKTLEGLLRMLHETTCLCVAASLTSSSEKVRSCSVGDWEKGSFTLQKEPAVFLIYRQEPIHAKPQKIPCPQEKGKR